ncbi:hypothetical protein TL18_04655 [Methanobrevibacter sp. YE315]|uniref:hypothetical protein n=1 Tax=Methanobrevibacter sp. YE315 TaxID=1609968 RepID=UPI000764DBF4|nr:hypothetical protein [Methanobrevibacter sp. YE315]AMD17371.1 hypothetical protein TL18_04655 [Methanobrevibacter sp. YE315]
MKKILIILILFILTIGAVSAVNINDFKIPDGFIHLEYEFNHDHSEGFMNGKGEGLIIYDYSKEYKDIFFVDNDNYISDPFENNIYTFVDGETELCGYIECIEHNGKQYVIQTTCSIDEIDNHGYNIRDNLLEFNKINNVKPIPV